MNHGATLQGAGLCARLLSAKPVLQMGILNVSPESFSDGGRYCSLEAAEQKAIELQAAGADILDIGGVSTRPGADELSTEVELKRVIPLLRRLKAGALPRIAMSLDTSNPAVAQVAAEEQLVDIINDVYAARKRSIGTTRDDSGEQTTAHIAAQHNLGLILMHMQGTPAHMQVQPSYENCLEEVAQFLEKQLDFAKSCGVSWCAIDPGIGFGKRLEHNLTLLNEKAFSRLKELGAPILIGLSRKSFLKMIAEQNEINLQFSTPDDEMNWRDQASAEWEQRCALWGAAIIRTHTIKNFV